MLWLTYQSVKTKCFNTQGTIRAGVAPASSTIVINCLALSNHEHNLVNSYIATYVGSLSLHLCWTKQACVMHLLTVSS